MGIPYLITKGKFVETSILKPQMLGMQPAIQMHTAHNETFFYRGIDKRIIGYSVLEEKAWNSILGPLVYAVTDSAGIVRYVGKWVSSTPLKSRWIRRGHIHHHEATRNNYLKEIESGRGPLTLWVSSAEELAGRLGLATQDVPSIKQLAALLELKLFDEWRIQLSWNHIRPTVSTRL